MGSGAFPAVLFILPTALTGKVGIAGMRPVFTLWEPARDALADCGALGVGDMLENI